MLQLSSIHYSLFTYLLHSLLNSRQMPIGFSFFNSSGNRALSQFCQHTGRTKRLMAPVPTEVNRLSDVAGKGPPCCIALPTSTPVGGPLRIIRPTRADNLSTTGLYIANSS